MEMHKADQVLSTANSAKRMIQLKLACNMNFRLDFLIFFIRVAQLNWSDEWCEFEIMFSTQVNVELWMHAKLRVISFLDLANKYSERTLSVQMAVVRL